jgi:transcriptional regulator with XRE-family HTH domain
MEKAARARYEQRVLAIVAVLELVAERKGRGISQKVVAERMGVSQPVVARLERPMEARWRQPSLAVLSRYAHALGLDLELRVRRSRRAAVRQAA